jgi:uncharacterized damage-inducible protein DinB
MTSLTPPLAVPEPRTEGEQFCFSMRRNMEGIVRAIEGVPQEALSWQPPFPNANTLGALAVHTVGSCEWWVLACVRGDDIARDRDAEFRATTTAADMRQRFEAWYAATEALIRDQPPEWFGAPSHHPNGGRTNRRCLMHTVEHMAQHFGHIELTTDLWRASAPRG